MYREILIAIISAFGGSGITAFFSRKKTGAETEDIQITTLLKQLEQLEKRVTRQAEEIEKLREKYKTSYEENLKKDKRISRLEAERQEQDERIKNLEELIREK